MRLLIFLCCFIAVIQAYANAPSIERVTALEGDADLTQYLVSEKLDGIRATWIQGKLVTRGGKMLNAPMWFTEHWPYERLDGELFAGRGKFQVVANTVLDLEPSDAMWRNIRFMVFDAPSKQPFSRRYAYYSKLIADCDSPYLYAVEQRSLTSQDALSQWLQEVVAKGGEGLMLHRSDAPFIADSSDHLLKLKPYMDAEATVIGHQPGRGKYQGMMGALIVEHDNGTRFKIGTGFSDQERANPPKVGSLVTYSYHGLTANGVPRFASFIHVRDKSTLPLKD